MRRITGDVVLRITRIFCSRLIDDKSTSTESAFSRIIRTVVTRKRNESLT